MTKSIIFICNQYGPGSGALKRIAYLQKQDCDLRTLAIATKAHQLSQNFQKSFEFTKSLVNNLFWPEKFSLLKVLRLLLTEILNSDKSVIFAQHQRGFFIILLLRLILLVSVRKVLAPTLCVVEVGSFNEKRLLYKVLSIITYHLVDRIICISETTLETLPEKGDQGQVQSYLQWV